VVVTSEATGVGAPGPSRLAADSVVASLDATGALSNLTGTGHTSFDQRTAEGAHQSGSSDQLDVRFTPSTGNTKSSEDSEIASVVQQGHVVLVQEPAPAGTAKSGAARPGKSKDSAAPQSPVQATADRSEYDGATRQMHLFGSPRLKSGGLDMTANQMIFSRATGDATAFGDVKASFIGNRPSNASGNGTGTATLPGASLLGGSGGDNGPVHAVAPVAELHQASEEVIFREGPVSGSGNQPRLWQAASSVSAPLIILNRQKQTLVAQSHGAATPVRTVLLGKSPAKPGGKAKSDAPSLIRLTSGDLHYSEGERLAILNAGSVGKVTAETTGSSGAATVVSQQAEVHLLPAGFHSQTVKPTPISSASNSSVESMTAHGHVTVDWPGRKGSGEKLVYLSENGDFTLTGTSAVPPRMTDQVRGTVTGSALIFHSRDDSVTVEGDGGKTTTETRSPK
jgi:lipopolysaccharide export system protein LptA